MEYILVSTSSLCVGAERGMKAGCSERWVRTVRWSREEREYGGEGGKQREERERERGDFEQQHTNQYRSISLNAWLWIKRQSKDVIQLAFQKFI